MEKEEKVGGFVRKLAQSPTGFQKLYLLYCYSGTCKNYQCINHGLVIITINFIAISIFYNFTNIS